jgi:hypothetical protein
MLSVIFCPSWQLLAESTGTIQVIASIVRRGQMNIDWWFRSPERSDTQGLLEGPARTLVFPTPHQ